MDPRPLSYAGKRSLFSELTRDRNGLGRGGGAKNQFPAPTYPSAIIGLRFAEGGAYFYTLTITTALMKKNQDQFLQRTLIALTNALNTPELLAALERFTYDAKAIQEALAIHERIEKLTRQREQALEVQYQTTQLLQQAKEEMLYLFRIHADTARLAYRREAQYQDTLNLSAAAPRETAACLRHIKRFYAHVPVAMMTKYHVPPKELAQAEKLQQRVQEALALQKKAMSQPQQLTDARQKALAELQTWMRRFDKTAKLAFDDQPQQLEVLGMVVR